MFGNRKEKADKSTARCLYFSSSLISVLFLLVSFALVFTSCSDRESVNFDEVLNLIDRGEYLNAYKLISTYELIELTEQEERLLRYSQALIKSRQGFIAIASEYFESADDAAVPHEPLLERTVLDRTVFESASDDDVRWVFPEEKLARSAYYFAARDYHKALISAKQIYGDFAKVQDPVISDSNEHAFVALLHVLFETLIAIGDYDTARSYYNSAAALVEVKASDFAFFYTYYSNILFTEDPDFLTLKAVLEAPGITPYWLSFFGSTVAERGFTERRYTETADLCKRLLANAEIHGHTKDAARLEYLLAGVFLKKQEWEESISHFAEANRLFGLITQPANVLLGQYHIGVCEFHLGGYFRADEIFRLVDRDLDRDEYPEISAELSSFYGSTQKILGNYRNAESKFLRALEQHTALDDEKGIYESLNNCGVIYYLQTDYENSLIYFARMETFLAERSDADPGEYAVLYNNIGNIYRKRNDTGLALSYYQKGLAASSGSSEIDVLLNLNCARCYYEYRDFEKALAYLDEAAEKADTVNARRQLPEIEYFRGRIFLTNEETSRAIASMEKAADQFARFHDKKNQAKTAYSLAIAYLSEKNRSKAIEYLLMASDLYDSIGSSIVGAENKRQFRSEYVYALETLIVLLVETDDIENAFTYLEKTKARGLLDDLAKNSFEITSLIPDELQDRKELLIRLKNNVSRELDDMWFPDTDTVAAIEEIDAALKEIDRQIELRAPEAVSIERARVRSLQDIQSNLAADEAVLSYKILNDDLYLFVVAHDTIECTILVKRRDFLSEVFDIDRVTTLETLAIDYRDLLLTPYSREADIRPLGNRLFADLIEPVYNKIKSIPNWIIVPDRQLFYLPFAALVLPDGRYLVETDVEITYAHSATLYINQKTKPAEEYAKPYLVFALPDEYLFANWSQDAFDMIESYENPDYHFNTDAKESILRTAELTQYRTIQFLQHGFTFDMYDHLKSCGLKFADDEADGYDGYLVLDEIFNLRMKPELLILTACSSGLGEDIPGEGLYGMNQGFFYAGARAILSTLWNVYIVETNRFSVILNQLRGVEGFSPKDAVIEAQRRLFKTNRHPVYWAPFVLFGYGG